MPISLHRDAVRNQQRLDRVVKKWETLYMMTHSIEGCKQGCSPLTVAIHPQGWVPFLAYTRRARTRIEAGITFSYLWHGSRGQQVGGHRVPFRRGTAVQCIPCHPYTSRVMIRRGTNTGLMSGLKALRIRVPRLLSDKGISPVAVL